MLTSSTEAHFHEGREVVLKPNEITVFLYINVHLLNKIFSCLFHKASHSQQLQFTNTAITIYKLKISTGVLNGNGNKRFCRLVWNTLHNNILDFNTDMNMH